MPDATQRKRNPARYRRLGPRLSVWSIGRRRWHRASSEDSVDIKIEDDSGKRFDRFCDLVYERQLSNDENYDNALLTLSSAALGLSVTFLSGESYLHSKYSECLIAAWVLFVITTVSTLFSYRVSQWALDAALPLYKKFIEEDQAQMDKNFYGDLNTYLSYISGLCFALAICCFTFFAINHHPEETTSDVKQSETVGREAPGSNPSAE